MAIRERIRDLLFPPRLAVVFVAFERPGHDPWRVFSTLRQYLAPARGARPTFLFIDNRHENRPLSRSGDAAFHVGGDNRFREFSGWQKGVDLLPEWAPAANALLLANDMFLKPGESFLKDYGDTRTVKRTVARRLVVGRIDTTGERYTARGRDVSRWVCTNAFFVPRRAVEQIGGLVSVGEDIDDFLPRDFPGPPPPDASVRAQANHYFLDTAPLNTAYKTWLVERLTRRWHSRFIPEAATWDIFRNKVRNILNEALLTARLSEAGFRPAPYGDKRYY